MLAVMRHTVIHLHSAISSTGAPDWVQLVPAGTFSGSDGRGPYRLSNPQAVIATSLHHFGGRLPIDENHSIDRRAPQGEPSPARGWIVELQERDGSIWGRVEWTDEGRQLVAGRAYRGISPAIYRDEKGEVVAVGRASLVNVPNLPQLATLHDQDRNMDFIAQLRAALGLGADVPEADVLAAVTANKTAVDTHSASLTAIATAAGLAGTLEAAGIVAELQSRQVGGDQVVTQLRGTVVELQGELTTLKAENAKDKATRFVDAAIAEQRVGVVPLRDHYIDQHMKDPARVEKEIGALPVLPSRQTRKPAADPADPVAALTDDQLKVCELMGVDPVEFAKTAKLEKELL